MSSRGLVIHHDELTRLEHALATAHDALTQHVEDTLTSVNLQTALWARTTQSRAAEMAYQRRLRHRIDELTAALEQIRTALADVRADAHDTEVTNVAVIG